MIKLKNLVIIVLLLIIVFFALINLGLLRKVEFDFVQKLNEIFVGNEMVVNTSPGIDLMEVRINLDNSEKPVFINGKVTNIIKGKYIVQKFNIFYKNILIGKAAHNNTKDWYVNKFIFNFFKENDKVKFTFKSKGNDKNAIYIWIEKENGKTIHKTYDSNGKLLIKWSK